MLLLIFVMTIFSFLVIQISILRSLGKSIMKWIAVFPLLGTIMNFVASGTILVFAGGAVAGICNMVSSVGVYFWLIGYAHHYDLRVEKKKHWLFTLPCVISADKPKHWLF